MASESSEKNLSLANLNNVASFLTKMNSNVDRDFEFREKQMHLREQEIQLKKEEILLRQKEMQIKAEELQLRRKELELKQQQMELQRQNHMQAQSMSKAMSAIGGPHVSFKKERAPVTIAYYDMDSDNSGQENDGYYPNSQSQSKSISASSTRKVLAAANVDLRQGSSPSITFDSSNNSPESMNFIVNQIIKDRSKDDNFLIFIHGYNNSPEYATELLKKLDNSIDSEQSGRIISLKFDWDGTESVFQFGKACENALKSVDYLKSFIMLMNSKGYKNLVFIAHSLGNYVLMETIKNVLSINDGQYSKIFTNCQFISFASAGSVEQLRDSLKLMEYKYFKRWISYFHRNDMALMAEALFKLLQNMENKRTEVMGNRPIYFGNCDKFECVDCSVLNKIGSYVSSVSSFIGGSVGRKPQLSEISQLCIKNHTYFMHPSIMLDVVQAVIGNKTPQERGLEKEFKKNGNRNEFYFKIGNPSITQQEFLQRVSREKSFWSTFQTVASGVATVARVAAPVARFVSEVAGVTISPNTIRTIETGARAVETGVSMMRHGYGSKHIEHIERKDEVMEHQHNINQEKGFADLLAGGNSFGGGGAFNLDYKYNDDDEYNVGASVSASSKNFEVNRDGHGRSGQSEGEGEIKFCNPITIIVGTAPDGDGVETGVKDDIKRFYNLCINDLKFDESKIISRGVNCAAFESNKRFIEWVKKGCNEKTGAFDSVIFYYSGHGCLQDTLVVGEPHYRVGEVPADNKSKHVLKPIKNKDLDADERCSSCGRGARFKCTCDVCNFRVCDKCEKKHPMEEFLISIKDVYSVLRKCLGKSKPLLMITDCCRGNEKSSLLKLDDPEEELTANKNSMDTVDRIYASTFFPLNGNCMIINGNTSNYVSYTNNTRNGSILTDCLATVLKQSFVENNNHYPLNSEAWHNVHNLDLRYQILTVREKAFTNKIELDGIIRGQMIEMRETMTGPVFIGNSQAIGPIHNDNINQNNSYRADFKWKNDKQLKKPLIVLFGDHSIDLTRLNQLFQDYYNSIEKNWVNVVRIDTKRANHVKNLTCFIENSRHRYESGCQLNSNFSDHEVDGVIVIFCGKSKGGTGEILCANENNKDEDKYEKFGKIYEIFDGKHCAYFRDKPKIFIINKYQDKRKAKQKRMCKGAVDKKHSKNEAELYHPDGNVLIVHNEYEKIKDNVTEASPFVKKFDSLMRNRHGLVVDEDGECRSPYLREMIVNIRNDPSIAQQPSRLEMIDTLFAPVAFCNHHVVNK